MHWYKRYPDAALAGMAELTLEERGAYNSILDLLYSRDGDLNDDDVVVARMIGVSRRTWVAVKSRLLKKGKLVQSGSKLTCVRVEKTLTEAQNRSESAANSARLRWEKWKKTKENNDPIMPPGTAERQSLLDIRDKSLEEREESILCPKPASDHEQNSVQGTAKRKSRAVIGYTEDFEAFWRSYPDTTNNSKQAAFGEWRALSEPDRLAAMGSLAAFAAYCRNTKDYRVLHCERYLKYRRFESFGSQPAAVFIPAMKV